MLKKTERIKKNELISLVLNKGKTLKSQNLMLKYLDSKLGTSLFTVLVPKKLFKTTVQKNRYRRRGMSLLAKHKNEITRQGLVVLMPAQTFLEVKFAELEKELSALLKKL